MICKRKRVKLLERQSGPAHSSSGHAARGRHEVTLSFGAKITSTLSRTSSAAGEMEMLVGLSRVEGPHKGVAFDRIDEGSRERRAEPGGAVTAPRPFLPSRTPT